MESGVLLDRVPREADQVLRRLRGWAKEGKCGLMSKLKALESIFYLFYCNYLEGYAGP